MTRQRIPDEVLAAAHARARARATRDWPEADRLKGEIEAAGWKIVDRGTDFALSPASPPDVADDGRIRYGSSASVPSRLADPGTGSATVIIVATDEPDAVARAIAALETSSPAGTSLVVVGNAPSPAQDAALDALEAVEHRLDTEVVRTSERLTPAAALNIGIRRAVGPVVIAIDPSVEPTGDIVTPLVHALDDPVVALAGGWGSVTRDRRRFEDSAPGEAGVDVIDHRVMAFRRADAAVRGPLDERLRTDTYAAVWWSLTLRDQGESGRHRRAVVVSGLPAIRHDQDSGTEAGDPARQRDLKRDFYSYLDQFGSRADLLDRTE